MSKPYTIDEINWPCKMDSNVQQKLLEASQPYQGIDVLNKMFDDPTFRGLLYCTKGISTMSNTRLDGQLLVSLVVGKGDWAGVNRIDDGLALTPVKTALASLKANIAVNEVQDSEFLYIPEKAIVELMQQDSSVYQFLFYLAKRMTNKLMQSSHISFFKPESKVIFYLTEMMRKVETPAGVKPSLSITQQLLSEIINVSRPRTNETLKALVNEGLIAIDRGRITLLDLPGLHQRIQSNEFEYYWHEKR
ncbi:Crp/Fnr family transcriptional regulator [Shewanella sp. WXL01]|uniref:Crp/Fnr family transcriptional regulator n=1 Tax=Shewanella TaxID=22 RepID=UPI0013EE954A|nr:MULTISPECIES: Crp/Fnr family transcriptional regulator [Shewanella]NKF49879.1 Crp/Fnr family transcriptional regulator [Shewanella sp. WXL01]